MADPAEQDEAMGEGGPGGEAGRSAKIRSSKAAGMTLAAAKGAGSTASCSDSGRGR
ncbi:MAG: hypothetical protein R3D25_00875 [Geminicoccaceae bacterium]